MPSSEAPREPQDGTDPALTACVKTASAWVRHYLMGAKAGGHVVDVAAGSGRHTRLALGAGHRVTAIDRSVQRLSAIHDPALTVIEHDLESGAAFPIAPGTADTVIVTNYLWRPILPAIIAAVAADGVLIYETFGVGNARFGKPSNPDYLLRAGELADAVAGRLVLIAAEHVTEPDAVVSRHTAVGSDHPWIKNPPSPFR